MFSFVFGFCISVLGFAGLWNVAEGIAPRELHEDRLDGRRMRDGRLLGVSRGLIVMLLLGAAVLGSVSLEPSVRVERDFLLEQTASGRRFLQVDCRGKNSEIKFFFDFGFQSDQIIPGEAGREATSVLTRTAGVCLSSKIAGIGFWAILIHILEASGDMTI